MKLKNLKLNFSKMIALRGVSLVLASATLMGALTGCGKKADCNVDGNHAHLYISEDGYVRYIDKEYLTYEGYNRSDEYISLSSNDAELYKFLDQKDLLKISDNLNVILEQQEQNKDYIEYRYRYTYLQPIPHYIHTGKTTTVFFSYIPITHYSWSNDPNHSRLTGEQRLCHYVYTAYKVEKDEKGKYVLIPSSEVDDITEVMDEFPYVKTKYYKAIDIEYGNDLDYEDGPSDLTPQEQEDLEKEYEGQCQDEELEENNDKTLKKTK